MRQSIEVNSIVNDNVGNSSEPLYFKLYRYWIEESPVFANPELFRIFCWLLNRARHVPGHVKLNSGKVVSLKVGEGIVGRDAASKALDMNPSTFRNRLEKLADMGVIKLDKKDKVFTRFSIVFPLGVKLKKDKPRTSRGQVEDKPRTSRGQVEDTNKMNETYEMNEMNKLSESVSDQPPPTENEVEEYLKAKYPTLPEIEIKRLAVEVIAALNLGKFKPEQWKDYVIIWAGSTVSRLKNDQSGRESNADKARKLFDEIKKKEPLGGSSPSTVLISEAMQSDIDTSPVRKPWLAELPDSWKGIK